MRVSYCFLSVWILLSPPILAAGTTELCLDGEFDLGARLSNYLESERCQATGG